MLSSQVCLRPTHVMSGVGTLEAEALKRKARLAALRNQQGDDNAEDTQLHKEEEKETVLKLRNYEPLSDIPAERGEAPALQSLKLAEQERAALQADPAALDTVDINTLAPRKPTWDLERDLAKKMERLERRTDRAIAELVTKRLKEAGDDEMAMDQLVTAGAQAEALDAEDSD